MGLPVRAPMDPAAITIPVRTPISLMGEICATSAGVRATAAPEVKPNRGAKTSWAALLVPGSQRARIRIVVRKHYGYVSCWSHVVGMEVKRIVRTDTVMTLKRPILSPMRPGRVRPKMEAALRIETRYCARSSDMPRSLATVVMKLNTGNWGEVSIYGLMKCCVRIIRGVVTKVRVQVEHDNKSFRKETG